MQEYGSTHPPERSGSPRRGLFHRVDEDEPRLTPTEHRIAGVLERAVDERLELGLRAIEEQATDLMREIASELWRASGRDARPEQERIVSLLSRDQAIRGLIASSDERFQALVMRSARLEDTLSELAESGRTTRQAMEASLTAMHEIAESPTLHGVETVRAQLEQVEHHIAAAFQHLDERGGSLTEGVLREVREHGELIARETTRIVEAIQDYVQGGAEAMGQLAQRVERHVETFAALDLGASDGIADGISGAVTAELRPVNEQLELMSEKVGLHGRNQDQIRVTLERLLEARVMGLAQLIRSDSEALRAIIQQRADAQDAMIREALDERLQALDWRLQGLIERTDEQAAGLSRSTQEQAADLARSTQEQVADLARSTQEQVVALSTAMSASIERSLSGLSERVDERLGVTTEMVAQRAAEAVDMTIASSFGQSIERINASMDSIEGVDAMIVESQASAEEHLRAHIDDRIAAIARLVRSDNQVLAEQLTQKDGTETVDPELLRQTLRAVKELQAGLASDVLGTVDRRFQSVSDQLHTETQSTAEAMVKVAEVLGEKMDRLSVQIDEGYGNDIQIVVDRMSDAIRAMSAAGRSQGPRYEVG